MNNFNEIDIENFYSKIQDEGGYDVECICCNKEVKNEKYFVHLLTNGNIIDTDEYQGNDDQGFYNVGSECKKRINSMGGNPLFIT